MAEKVPTKLGTFGIAPVKLGYYLKCLLAVATVTALHRCLKTRISSSAYGRDLSLHVSSVSWLPFFSNFRGPTSLTASETGNTSFIKLSLLLFCASPILYLLYLPAPMFERLRERPTPTDSPCLGMAPASSSWRATFLTCLIEVCMPCILVLK